MEHKLQSVVKRQLHCQHLPAALSTPACLPAQQCEANKIVMHLIVEAINYPIIGD